MNEKTFVSALAVLLVTASTPARAQATVAEWQKVALQRFPALGEAGSAMNERFVTAVAAAKRERPELFADSRWPLILAEEIGGSIEPRPPSTKNPDDGAASEAALRSLEVALDSHHHGRVAEIALRFQHPVPRYRSQLADLAVQVSTGAGMITKAQAERRQIDPELARLRKNAAVTDRPNPLNPGDDSNHRRAEEIRTRANGIERDAEAKIEAAKENVAGIEAAIRRTIDEIRQANAEAAEQARVAKAKAAEQARAKRAAEEKLDAIRRFMAVINEEEARPAFASKAVEPTYDATFEFINTKLLQNDWSLRFGARSHRFILIHPDGAFFFDAEAMNPGVKFTRQAKFHMIQLLLARRDAAIRAVTSAGTDTERPRTIGVPCDDEIDSEKLAKAFRHLFIMAGAQDDPF